MSDEKSTTLITPPHTAGEQFPLPTITDDHHAAAIAQDNDTWFIYFAQITVDRMLQRYGIAANSTPDPREEITTLQIAA